jgi:hypothetical protein
MSKILYYSSYCDNCKKLLHVLSKSQIKKDIHFISIDRRVQKNNGATYIVLENSQEIILPPTVSRVPALLLINKGHHVLFGEEIYNHLKPIENDFNKMAIKNDSEPEAFSLGGGGAGGCGTSASFSGGVVSDNYSFLDQTCESLSAKGDGGMRQLYNYATINQENTITTPPDNYSPDTIGEATIEQLQRQRQKDITR